MNDGAVVLSDLVGDTSFQKVLSGDFTTVCQVIVIYIDHGNEAANRTTLALR